MPTSAAAAKSHQRRCDRTPSWRGGTALEAAADAKPGAGAGATGAGGASILAAVLSGVASAGGPDGTLGGATASGAGALGSRVDLARAASGGATGVTRAGSGGPIGGAAAADC